MNSHRLIMEAFGKSVQSRVQAIRSFQEGVPGYEPGMGYVEDEYRSPSEDSGVGMGITERAQRCVIWSSKDFGPNFLVNNPLNLLSKFNAETQSYVLKFSPSHRSTQSFDVFSRSWVNLCLDFFLGELRVIFYVFLE